MVSKVSSLERASWIAGIVGAAVAVIAWQWPPSAATQAPPKDNAGASNQSGVINIQVAGGGTVTINGGPTGGSSSVPKSEAQSPPTALASTPPSIPSVPESSLPDQGPSFDCRRATFKSEKIICSSKELAILDLALSNAYRDVVARADTEGKLVLKNDQNRWLRNTREECADVVCLRSTYEKRISELKAALR